MNPRMVLIIGVLVFLGLLLVMGARTFARWLKIHYPRRASAILLGLWIMGIAAGWFIIREIRDQPIYQPNDLITLQEPVVARAIASDRESRFLTCVVDLHEHLGVLELEREGGTMKARVESNNISAPIYCAIGTEVRVEVAWLHRPTVTRRE
jgi:hypothetical protein